MDFLPAACCALVTILPALFFMREPLTRPVAVFCLRPAKTTALAILPLAMTETRLAFMAFFIAAFFITFMLFMAFFIAAFFISFMLFMAFITFMVFATFMVFIASAMAAKALFGRAALLSKS